MEKLIANEGMILTNGEAFGRVVFLGTGDSAENWHEITEAEYEVLVENDNPATEEDYQDALREMGVSL